VGEGVKRDRRSDNNNTNYKNINKKKCGRMKRAESREQRAESREQRAESREQTAESRE
jgi:hypothetical protein